MSQQNILDLSKKFELNLQKNGFDKIPVMKTRLAVDRSGSMSSEFSSGWVKKTIDLFLGAALKFDDNQELELTFYNNTPTDVETISLTKYDLDIPSAFGGTQYTPAIEALIEDLEGGTIVNKIEKPASGFFGKLFGKTETVTETVTIPASDDPIYIGFITDGDPQDRGDFLSLLESIKDKNVFIQFIVLRTDVNREFLGKVGAYKNVDVAQINNPTKMTTDDLYEILANKKLLAWIK